MTHWIRVQKWHGLGNDYLLVDGADLPADQRDAASLSKLARILSDRHRGIGADGLIAMLPPPSGHDVDLEMKIVNADGGHAEMCGNGIRCVASAWVRDREGDADLSRPVRIQTGAGRLEARVERDDDVHWTVSVTMGQPSFGPRACGATPSELPDTTDRPVTLMATDDPSSAVEAVLVSVGNPHAVVFVPDDPKTFDLAHLGPRIEHHPAFPDRLNLQIVRVLEAGATNGTRPGRAVMRSWERGAGATQACGTGAAAVLAAGIRTGRLGPTARIDLPGGMLELSWPATEQPIRQMGPATLVATCTAVVPPPS